MTDRPNILLFMPDLQVVVETSDLVPARHDPRFDDDLRNAIFGA